MSLCEHCVKGVIHEGEAKGTIEKIEGVEVYVATPTKDYPKDKAILLLTDIFGISLINSKLLADSFAENGLLTFVPDLFDGDAAPPDALTGGKFDLGAWLGKHSAAEGYKNVEKVLPGLKAKGIKDFAGVGYCYGVKLVFLATFNGHIKVAAGNHPSFIQIPEDLEKFAATGVPILLNTCEIDSMFPISTQAKADEIFKDSGVKLYKRNYYPGCTHGFTVRGDLSDPKVKHGNESAFKECYEWIATKL